MARDHGERLGDTAVGEGDACSGWHGDSARDARNDFDGYAVCLARETFLPSAPQDVGVATLEADDGVPTLGLLDKDRVDAVLGDRVVAGGLADVDDPDRRGKSRHDASGCEAVDDDDVCTGEELVTADGEQTVVSGAATDEGDPTGATGAVTAEVEAAVAQREVDAVTHRRREQGVATAMDGDGHSAVGSDDVGASGDARSGCP
ncbi:hypothetical protein JNB_01895 [Janibacter sp. HTCC2649]|nr:hypothetical protein JNB_01895 [Janibacter sp. HTCC2649]